ncbi:MAG: hypothetical protein ACRDRJ_01245 [Streptosporangiaceae bacterium]
MTATTNSAHAISSFTSPFAADTSTCAMPGCQTVITLARSLYIDGCGQVCDTCAGPSPAGLDDIDPPF